MGLIAKDSSGEDFEPIPQGLHPAVCYAVFDVGTQYSFDKYIHQCIVCWELSKQRIEVNGEDLPRAISKWYTVSLHVKANLVLL